MFVTLPGYEWSGNTAVGGDRNVCYRTEGRPIFRSSHALLPDRSDLHTDATDAQESGDPADVAIRFRVDADQVMRVPDYRFRHVSEEQVA